MWKRGERAYMRSEYTEPKIFNKILAIMPPTSARALRLSFATGMRIGDVLALERSSLVGNKITFTAQKTGKSATVVIDDQHLLKDFRLREITQNR